MSENRMTYRNIWTMRLLIVVAMNLLPHCNVKAELLTERYTKNRPLVIVCDWDKAPYEFSDDEGEPAGSNVDVLSRMLDDIGITYRFVTKEWSNAIKTFERGDADLILANAHRFKNNDKLFSTQIINYNRLSVAMTTESKNIITQKMMEQEGVVLKTGDYTGKYFVSADSATNSRVEYLSPKVALTGLLAGDCKYFVWGEEPLKWKIKKLNLEGIYLNEVGLPVSEVHIWGRDKELIETIDDHYSRLKQSGELEQMLNKWFHPERVQSETSPVAIYIIFGILTLATLCYLFNRLAKAHVKNATRNSTLLSEMMYKALQMGNFQVMEYDIVNDLFTNCYGGTILPKEGMSLEDFTYRIHPDQRNEFAHKMELLKSGRERRFMLDKRWNAGTDQEPHWLNFQGHAICEYDKFGKPCFIVNAIHDVTHEMEEDQATHNLLNKYESLTQIPVVAVSFYDADGFLIGLNEPMKKLCNITDDLESKRYWEKVCMFDIPLFRNIYSKDCKDTLTVSQHMEYPDMGIDRYITFSIRPLLNEQGDIANYICTCMDVTDERNMALSIKKIERQIKESSELKEVYREQLQQMHSICKAYKTTLDTARQRLEEESVLAKDSVRLKSGFMASMTHELRTPLNAIVGFTGVLESLGESEERTEFIRIIRNSSDMLQRLINDIIEASSLTDGPTTIQPVDINFVSAFEDICLTLQQRVQDSGLTFIKENPYNTFMTTVDIGRIQQVLTNFVTNAVKFTKQGHIRLGYRYEQHGLYLYCEDTGIGIPKDKQEHIFDRFVKLDEFTQGTGMGLAICKSIAERCQGKIGLISEGKDKGCTFWTWIPCERRLS